MDPSVSTYQGEESDYLVADGLLGHLFKYDKFDLLNKGTYGAVTERSLDKASRGTSRKHSKSVVA